MLILRGTAQEITLQVAEERYQQEVAKLTTERDQKNHTLIQSYIGELMRYEARARSNSDLDGVLAAREEITRVETEGATASAQPPEDGEIARLQSLMLRQARVHARTKGEQLLQFQEGVIRFASTQSMNRTQQNDIEGAIAWRDWAQGLQERPETVRARQHVQAQAQHPSGPRNIERHSSFQGRERAEWIREPLENFVDTPRAFILGHEPRGREPRQTESTPSAAGSGHTLLQGRLRLVDEEDTLNRYNNPWSSFRERSHLYVPRLQITPLPNRNLEESLVVFDLYRRGSGARREIIRTDSIWVPPIPGGTQVVVDAGVYSYNSARYRAVGGYRSDQATADLFHGFIVTIFDTGGRIIYQRSNDRGLDSFARREPPDFTPPTTPEHLHE